jgi:O-antigen/teichoic acid export membrane protein
MTKNFLYTVLLSLVNLLFPVLSFPYASHVLGPEGIGSVQMAVSLGQYFALFAALGIPIYGITEIARHRDDPEQLARSFSELSLIFFGASLLLTIVYLTIISTIPFFQDHFQLFLLAGSLVLLSFSYTDWFFSGLEAFKSITLRSVIIKVVALLLLLVLVKTKADRIEYLFVIVFSILGNQLLSLAMCFRRTRFTLKGIQLRRHFQPLFYLFSTTLAASIYTMLDTVLLGFLSDDQSVGLYAAAVKLVKLTIPIVTAMGVILIPLITRHFHQNNQVELHGLLDQSFRFLLFFSIPVCTGLTLLAPECIFLFSGHEFAEAVPVMRIVAWLPLLIGLGHFYCFQILLPAGKTQKIFYAVLAGAITCLLLNWLLVPSFKSVGAAIANIATEVVVTLLYIYFMRQFFTAESPWKYGLHALIGSFTFIPIILLLRSWQLPVPVLVPLATICCALTFFAVQWWLFKNYFLLDFVQPLKDWLLRKKNMLPDEY